MRSSLEIRCSRYHYHYCVAFVSYFTYTVQIIRRPCIHWSRNTCTMNTVFILVFHILASSLAEPDPTDTHVHVHLPKEAAKAESDSEAEDRKGNKHNILYTLSLWRIREGIKNGRFLPNMGGWGHSFPNKNHKLWTNKNLPSVFPNLKNPGVGGWVNTYGISQISDLPK